MVADLLLILPTAAGTLVGLAAAMRVAIGVDALTQGCDCCPCCSSRGTPS